MKKQLLFILLALMPMVASADDSGSCGTNVTYTYIKSTHTLTISGSGTMKNYDWNTAPWYNYSSEIVKAIIEDGVTSIGDYTFYYCSSLTSVTIPNSVTSIGGSAFYRCSGLASVNVEKGNTKYDSRDNCNAIIETTSNTLIFGCKTTTIPNSVTSIGNNAFLGCSGLTSVTIPNSVTSIGECSFYGCSGLTSVTIPNSVISIGNYAFSSCSGLTAVVIPNSVTSIGNYAFEDCYGLTSVTIPDGVTSIGEATFLWCSCLTSVTIGNSVTSIGENAFYGCDNLNTLTILSSTPPTLGESAFSISNSTKIIVPFESLGLYESTVGWNNYSDVIISSFFSNGFYYLAENYKSPVTIVTNPNGYSGDIDIPETGEYGGITFNVSSIDKESFAGCSELHSITIPKSITNVGTRAFYGCTGLESVTIHSTSIGSWFSGLTSIKDINIGNEVAIIGDNAFKGCSGITSIAIPNSVTSIGSNAFQGCTNLISVSIPSSVTSIGGGSFQSCTSLSSVTIPNSVTSIGNNAFAGCAGLEDVTIHSTSIGSWFSGLTSIKDINIGNEVAIIGDNAFRGCSGITSIAIPNSVTSIGSSAFWNCINLTSAIIPNKVTSIANSVFSGCTGLQSISIPNSVTSIGSSAFSGCISLKSIDIPNSVREIGNDAFYNCSGLTSVTIPNSITILNGGVFQNCSGLSSVAIPNSITSLGNYAFAGCIGLTSIEIPNSVTSIGSSTFYGTGLTSILIPHSVTSIGSYAFQNCDNLMTVNSKIAEPFNCKDAFAINTLRKGTLYIPAGTKDLYTRFDGWREFLKIEDSGVAVPQKYILSFVVDNNELSRMEMETGSKIMPPASDNEGNTISWYTYPATMPAHNLVVYGMVQKPAAPTKYTITYVLDGQMYRTVVVEEGAAVSKEKEPYKEGYTFNGWQNEPTTMPGHDVTVNGTFSVNTYRLSFIVDNEELSARNVTYGAAITAPTKDGEGNEVTWYSYPAAMPAHDLVVYGMTVKEPEEPEPIVPEPEVFVWLTVNDCQSGYTKIKVKQGAEQTLNFTAEEGWKISNIFMDGRYVTSRLAEDGTFVTPAITGDASIIVVYEEVMPSGVRAASRSQADVKVVSDGVVISNAEPDTRCVVYQTDGKQVVNTVINEGTRKIALQKGQAYILTIDGRTLKFAL